MSSRDERVVEMRFDNAQFERGIKESMRTIDEFENKLKFDKVANSFKDLERVSGSVNFGGLQKGIDGIVTGFNAMSTVGVLAMTKIATSAINAGTNIANSFIQPMRSGLQEYETQINSVQTILSNTRSQGTDIGQVNAALDELNTYADKTIYNFTEMTRNIGTFTAAGIDLDTSVSAIKGIANLAAVSGSTSQQASTAMYQLSQALASGTVKLQDWNSVVNAGMGGQVFQDALKETARLHGIAVDEMIEDQGSFRESLKEGWITSEVLTETLQKFTGDLTEEQLKSMGYTEEQAKEIVALGNDANDAATKVKTFTQLLDTLNEENQSGWTQSWEIIIGDFEQARDFWSEIAKIISGIIAEFSNARNNFLESIFGGKSGLISRDRWLEFMSNGNAGKNMAFFDALKQTVKASGEDITELEHKYGSFMAAVASGEVVTEEMVTNTINGTTEAAAKSLDEIQQLVNDIENGLYGNGEDRRHALEEAGYDYDAIQALVNADWNGYDFGNLDWDNLTEDQLRNLGVTEDQIAAFKELQDQMGVEGSDVDNLLGGSAMTGREMLVESITNLAQAGADALHLFGEVWNEVFPPAGPEGAKSFLEMIMGITEQFQIFTHETQEDGTDVRTGLTDFGEKLKIIFTGIADAIGIITDAFSAAFDFISGIFSSIFGLFSDGSTEGEGSGGPIDFLVSYAEGISKIREDLQNGTFIPNLIENVTTALSNLGEMAKSVIDPIKALFVDGEGNLTTGGKVGGILGLLLAVLAPVIGSKLLGGGAIAGLGGFGPILGIIAALTLPGLIGDFLGSPEDGNIFERLQKRFDKIVNSDVVQQIKEKIGNIKEVLGLQDWHPIEDLQNLFKDWNWNDVFGSIGNVFSGIGDAISGWAEENGIDPIGWITEKFDAIKSWAAENGIDLSFLDPVAQSISDFFTNLPEVKFGEGGIDPIGWILEKINVLSSWITENTGIDFTFFETSVFAPIREAWTNFVSDVVPEGSENGDVTIVGAIGLTIAAIKQHIEEATGLNFNSLDEFIESLKQRIQDITGVDLDEGFDPIANLKAAWTDIKNWFTTVATESTIVQTAIDVIQQFVDFIMGIGEALFGPLGGDVDTSTDSMDAVSESVEGMSESLSKVDTSAANPVLDFLSQLGGALGDLVLNGVFPALMDLLKDLPASLGMLMNFYVSGKLAGFFSELGEALNNMSTKISKVNTDSVADKLLKMAAALFILVLAIAGASKIENPEKAILPLIEAVGALALGLAADGKISKAFGKDATLDFTSILAMAFAIKIIVDVIHDIIDSGLTVENSWQAILIIGAIGLVLGAATGLSKGFKTANTFGSGVGNAITIAALIFGVKTIANTVIDLVKEGYSLESLKEGLKIVGVIAGGLTLFTGLLNRSTGLFSLGKKVEASGGGGFFKGLGNAFSIGGLVLGIKGIVESVKDVAEFASESEGNLDALWAATGIISALTGVLGAVESLMNVAGGKGGFWGAVGGLAGSFGIDVIMAGLVDTIDSITKLAKEDVENIEAAGVVVNVLVLFLGAFESAFMAIGGHYKLAGDAAAVLGAFGEAIAAIGITTLVSATTELAKLPVDQITAAGIVVDVMVGLLGAFESLMMAVGGKYGVAADAATVLGGLGEALAAIGISTLVDSTTELAKAPVDNINAAGTVVNVLAGIMGAVESLITYIGGKYGLAADAASVLGGLGQALASMGLAAIVEQMAALAQYPVDQIYQAGIAVDAIAGIMGGMQGLLAAVGTAFPGFSLAELAAGGAFDLFGSGLSNVVTSVVGAVTELAALDVEDAKNGIDNLNYIFENLNAVSIGAKTGEYAYGSISGFIEQLIHDIEYGIATFINGILDMLGVPEDIRVPLPDVTVEPETAEVDVSNIEDWQVVKLSNGDEYYVDVPKGTKCRMNLEGADVVFDTSTGELFNYNDVANTEGYEITDVTPIKIPVPIVPDEELVDPIDVGGAVEESVASVEMDPVEVDVPIEGRVVNISGTEYFLQAPAGSIAHVEMPDGTEFYYDMSNDQEVNAQIAELNSDIVVGQDDGVSVQLAEDALADLISPEAQESATSQAEELGESVTEAVNEAANNGEFDMHPMAAHAVEAGDDAFEHNSPSKIFIPLGESIPEGVAVGINQGGSYLITAFTNMVNSSIVFLAQFPPQFQQHGLDVTSNIAWGIDMGGGVIATSLNNMHNSMLIVLGNMSQGFDQAGYNMMLGLAEGISNGASAAINAATRVATDSLNAAKQALDERSPSKKAMRIGEFFSQGLGIGISNAARFVTDRAGVLGDDLIGSLRTTAQLVDAVMNDELDMSPTITPVIDMSNLQNANNLMDGVFRSRATSLAYSIDARNAEVVDPIDRLIERLDAKNDFGNTTIYMDGARLNDDEAMRAVTLDFLYGLKRKAAL